MIKGMEFGSTALGKCVGKKIKSVSYDKNLNGDERIILRVDGSDYLDIELNNKGLCVSYVSPPEFKSKKDD